MSDELNVWREACRCYEDGAARDLALPMRDMVIAGDQAAAAVIRTYGDERHAAGYQAAIADVVKIINAIYDDGTDVDGLIHRNELADEITSRLGKGQDHG